MKIGSLTFLFFLFLKGHLLFSQSYQSTTAEFFNDTSIVNATLLTNISKLINHKETGYRLTGTFITGTGDSVIKNPVMLEIRGHFRKDFCYLPPVKIDFKYEKTSKLHNLGSLKLVGQCKASPNYEQYLLKEFLVYRIYNLLTDKSFHVRLLNLNLEDSLNRKKPIHEYAFLIEDLKDLAKRNNCVEFKNRKLFSETTDRRQMTIVSIFEYMIGNTDWGVAVNHNTRLIIPGLDSLKRPFVIPYDFDYSGFVNTGYGVPDEMLGIENVRQRLYRGYPRTMDELNEVLDIFKKQKEKIYALINNFELLTSKSKKEMTGYLDDFFAEINSPDEVKYLFIKKARTD
jgi:hypothetical protein